MLLKTTIQSNSNAIIFPRIINQNLTQYRSRCSASQYRSCNRCSNSCSDRCSYCSSRLSNVNKYKTPAKGNSVLCINEISQNCSRIRIESQKNCTKIKCSVKPCSLERKYISRSIRFLIIQSVTYKETVLVKGTCPISCLIGIVNAVKGKVIEDWIYIIKAFGVVKDERGPIKTVVIISEIW